MGKFLLANSRMLGPLFSFAFSKLPTTNALVRTTIAPTIFSAGVKDNVLPSSARANLNIRVHPSDSIDTVVEYVRSLVDEKIQVKAVEFDQTEPSKVACTDCNPFRVIVKTIEKLYPDIVITPFLFVAASDSRHYRKISKNSYGFTPFVMVKSEMAKFHGFDERIPIKDYIDLIQYYSTLIQNMQNL